MSDIFLVKSHLILRKKNKVQNCRHYFFCVKSHLAFNENGKKNNSLTVDYLSKDIFAVEKSRKEEQQSEPSCQKYRNFVKKRHPVCIAYHPVCIKQIHRPGGAMYRPIQGHKCQWHHEWRRVSSKSHEWCHWHEWPCIGWYIPHPGRCISNPLE